MGPRTGVEQAESISWPDGVKGDLNQGWCSFIRFSCLCFFVLCIISVSLVCLYYLAKCLASQAVSNDAYVEE